MREKTGTLNAKPGDARPAPFGLLASRSFLPLFAAQFLGAGNDNLFKNAMAFLIIYQIGDRAGASAGVLTTAATGLFMLPYFLFSATAGELADRFEKSGLIKYVKFCEILIVALGAAGLLLANVSVLFVTLFLLGVQATFFGPLKYAVLPEYLRENQLLTGNALIEGGTFIAILLGTITAGILIVARHGIFLISGAMLLLAICGFAASVVLPRAHAGNAGVPIRANPLAGARDMLATVAAREPWLAVLGISWFWALGAILLTEFQLYAKDILHVGEESATAMLTIFSIGIAAGSILCGRLLKGEISARHVPFAAFGMALFILDLYFASNRISAPHGIAGLAVFLHRPATPRILFDLFMIAACGGIFTVPLYAILQSRVPEAQRARAVAANNVMNAIFMVAASAIAAGLLAAGVTVIELFLILAIASFAVALYICRILPRELLRTILAWALRLAYGVEVRGLANLKRAVSRAVVVANHVSFLDALLIAVFVPGDTVFAIDTQMARKWYVRPFVGLVDICPLDPLNPLSIKRLTRKVQEGKIGVIFPEGKLTRTGALMKVYEGPGVIAQHADAPVVPLRIDGAQYTPFSRLRGKVRLRWFPKITLTLLPPQRFAVAESLAGRQRRAQAGAALYDLMSAMVFETGNRNRTLFEAFLDARALHGGSVAIIEDMGRKPVTYDRLTAMSLGLGRALARVSAPGEAVGLLLPNSTALATAFLALQAKGRVPAMLNFTAGAANIRSACQTAAIKRIVTSRQFAARAHLGTLMESLGAVAEIVWLEDLTARLRLGDKLAGIAGRFFAKTVSRRHAPAPSAPAVILFTSGSEGAPKAVVLSHANIIANCLQLGARIDFNAADSVFNVLPLFHSFGLTGGFLLPILSGVKSFLYPSPLDYRFVPELVYDTNSTIFFGTNTFLSGYAKRANPYDFYSLRYVFAGAERVEDTTRRVFADKFGLRILEGYGATEAGPVIACNTPMHFKAGSTGRFLPGIEHRIEPVPGIAEGGRLFVRGPNIMLGYMRSEHPGIVEPLPDGWYDTGDIVRIDDDGFVYIVGRARRFAKIGGEMISLAQVETEIGTLWPGYTHAVIAVPDTQKGEQLVLITDFSDARSEILLAHFKMRGHGSLMAPRVIHKVDAIPLLGTGKIDYGAAAALAAVPHH